MAEPDTGSTPPAEQVASARHRIPCSSCGALLREGAILCPQCGTDFRRAGDEPSERSSEPVVLPIWGPPRPETTSADERLARLSLIIAVGAPIVNLVVLPLLARLLGPPSLSLAWALFGLWLGTVLASALAIRLARQAVRRIDNTRDKRGLMVAQWGLMIGWAHILYVIVGFVLGFVLLPFELMRSVQQLRQ